MVDRGLADVVHDYDIGVLEIIYLGVIRYQYGTRHRGRALDGDGCVFMRMRDIDANICLDTEWVMFVQG